MEHGGIWEINLKQSTGTGIFTSMDGSFWRWMSVNSYYSPIECLETDLQNGPSKRKTSILQQRIDFFIDIVLSGRVAHFVWGGQFLCQTSHLYGFWFSSWWISNPSDKCVPQIRSFPQIGAEHKKCLTPPPRHHRISRVVAKQLGETFIFHPYGRKSIRVRPSS